MDVPPKTAYYPATPLTSDTTIHGTSQAAGGGPWTVGDFWAWAYSDVLDSVSRGTFAEFLVKTALHIGTPVRAPGAPVDLLYGASGLQIKSSSAVQSWALQSSPRISFGIKPSSAGLLLDRAERGPRQRSGDCWVFCVFRPSTRHLGVARVELLDVANWWFWAVPRHWLPAVNTITLDYLRLPIARKVDYGSLRGAVDEAIQRGVAGEPLPTRNPMNALEWQEEEGLHLVSIERLKRIVELVENVAAALAPVHPGWMPQYQPSFAGIRSADHAIRLRVRADLFETDGIDVRIGLRVPLGRDVPATWRGGEPDKQRDSWWSTSSLDIPGAESIAGVLHSLYSGDRH